MVPSNFNIVGDPDIRDQHIIPILTGKMDYYSDRLPGRKLYGAIKTSTISKGWIKLSNGGGSVVSFIITNYGSGYTSAPAVTIAGGSGTGAAAKANIDSNGRLSSVSVVAGGTNYSSSPRVTISGGGGYGAAATTYISTRSAPMIDVTRALKEPGVRDVVTYSDVPTWTQLITQWGQEVAGVVADDYFTAVRACQLINITYETMPAVIDPDEAINPSSPLAVPGGSPTTGTNVGPPSNITRGDVNKAFASAPVIVSHEQPWTSRYPCNTFEPHGCVASWIGDDAYIWFPSTDVHSGKNAVVNGLGIPGNRVHAFSRGTGGGLDDKSGIPAGVPALVMSRLLGGVPVQLVEQRNVVVSANSNQFGTRQSIKVGAQADGTLLALDIEAYTNTGRMGSFNVLMNGIQNTYTIPNYRHNCYIVNTNTPFGSTWLGAGDVAAALGYDSALDLLAVKLNMTPYALRMKNVRDPSLPAQDGTKLVWGGTAVPGIFRKLYEQSGYAQKWHAPGLKTMADGRLHGIGLVGHIDAHGSVNGLTRYLSMVMTADGKILLNVGGPRAFQTSLTSLCIMVAEEMGMAYSDVRVGEWGNTDTTLTAGIESGIEYAGSAGTAAINLGSKARTDIFRNAITKSPFSALIAAGVTRAVAVVVVFGGIVTAVNVVNPGSGYTGAPVVSFSGGGGTQAYAVANVANGGVASITVINGGSGYTSAPAVTISGISIADLDAANSIIFLKTDAAVNTTYRAAMSGTPLTAWSANGWSASLRSHAVGDSPIGSACNTNGSGGAAAEVLVDPETGEVEVTGLWNCVDTGRTIYRKGTLKDLLGGCELMMAQLLFYGDDFDPATGALMNPQFIDARFPTALDVKDVFTVSDVESDDAAGPYGTHGAIFSCSSNVSAIYCAIYDAIGVFPDMDGGALSADRILKALGKA